MRLIKILAATFILCFTPCALAQTPAPQTPAPQSATPKPAAPAAPLPTPAQQMAATVLLQHPASATTPATCTWG